LGYPDSVINETLAEALQTNVNKWLVWVANARKASSDAHFGMDMPGFKAAQAFAIAARNGLQAFPASAAGVLRT
jgi:hypothetical protein